MGSSILIQLESDYASTMLLPLSGDKGPLRYFMDKFDDEQFVCFDKWATTCSVPKIKVEDIEKLGSSFDQCLLDDHVSDGSFTKMKFLTELNAVSLYCFARLLISYFLYVYTDACSCCTFPFA